MTKLPDFLLLSKEAAERESARHLRLKQEFNSRARQTAPEMEAARALLIEDSLRQALEREQNAPERERIQNQLAENLAAQGRFLEAAQTAFDDSLKEFYAKVSDALFKNAECECAPPIHIVDHHRIALPKYRVIKEIYSIPHSSFGFLVECARCAAWTFLLSSPLPPEIAEKDFQIGKTPNDLESLKI